MFLVFDGGDSEIINIERDILGKATGERETAALMRSESHSHEFNVAVDGVDKLLMCLQVCGDQAKIVCVWQSHKVCIVQIVANLFRLDLQVQEQRVEGHEKN